MAASRAFAQFDVVFTVLSHAGIYHSARCRRVNRLWADAGDKRLAIAFSPDRVLGGFVTDVPAFRSVMAYRDVIVAGARALDAFGPFDSSMVTDHTPLEVMVQREMGADICNFLTRDGYRKKPRPRAPLDTQVVATFGLPLLSLFHPNSIAASRPMKPNVSDVVRMTRDGRIIDVVFTIGSPVIALFKSGCTLRFNFFTWEHAYCLYPDATLKEHRGIASDTGERDEHLDLEVFGFDALRARDLPYPPVADSLPPGDRWVGDKETWRVSLPGIVNLPARPSAFNWAANGVKLRYHIDPSKPSTATTTPMRCSLSSYVLRHDALCGWDYAVPPGFIGDFDHQLRQYAAQAGHGMFWRHVGPSANSLLTSFVDNYKTSWDDMPELVSP